jgi:hypothetical protein
MEPPDSKINMLLISRHLNGTIQINMLLISRHLNGTIQVEWSLLTRNVEEEIVPVEEEIVPVCKELDITIVAYSPLARNLLASQNVEVTDEDWRKERPSSLLARENVEVTDEDWRKERPSSLLAREFGAEQQDRFRHKGLGGQISSDSNAAVARLAFVQGARDGSKRCPNPRVDKAAPRS